MLNKPPDKERIFVDFWPLCALIKAPSQYSTTEHLLHEYKLNDKILPKAQLKQLKIFQNFPTSLAPAAPNAPPLPAVTNPKVSPLLEPNDSNNDSREILFDIKTGNTFLDNNDKSFSTDSYLQKIGTYLLSSVTEAL
ncbi:hypothetical protein Celaphus_00015905 [Cervus elaphus hippelaphus]|uniref:Uncharacterized protein n=1 Tax=Cervus elaphus hippelaphus TaxID=46360 RepID=A0A212C1V4_CEREH|nr:hypothetical protein Celaphus_00015905 [Cervus elaphus hippelaphus]